MVPFFVMTLDTSFCDVARFANRTKYSGEIFRAHRARRNSFSRPTPKHHTLQRQHRRQSACPVRRRHDHGRGLLRRRLNSRASCGTVVARSPSRSRRGRAALRGRSPRIAPSRRGRGKCVIALAREDGGPTRSRRRSKDAMPARSRRRGEDGGPARSRRRDEDLTSTSTLTLVSILMSNIMSMLMLMLRDRAGAARTGGLRDRAVAARTWFSRDRAGAARTGNLRDRAGAPRT